MSAVHCCFNFSGFHKACRASPVPLPSAPGQLLGATAWKRQVPLRAVNNLESVWRPLDFLRMTLVPATSSEWDVRQQIWHLLWAKIFGPTPGSSAPRACQPPHEPRQDAPLVVTSDCDQLHHHCVGAVLQVGKMTLLASLFLPRQSLCTCFLRSWWRKGFFCGHCPADQQCVDALTMSPLGVIFSRFFTASGVLLGSKCL